MVEILVVFLQAIGVVIKYSEEEQVDRECDEDEKGCVHHILLL